MEIVCKFCGKVLTSTYEYYVHYIRECKSMPKTRRCPICGAKFPSIRLLKVHLVNEALVEAKHRALLIARFS